MRIRKVLLIPVVLLICGVSVHAQPAEKPGPNVNNIPAFRMEQHDKWLKGEENFPAKERNMWQVGAHVGMLHVMGDVRSEMSYGYGLHVRKALGYSASFRVDYIRGRAFGLDWQPSTGISENTALNGTNNPKVDYYDEVRNEGIVYHNYRMRMDMLSVDGILNINNLKFHKRQDIFAPYIFLGLGAQMYHTDVNQLDGNGNMYVYDNVPVFSGNIDDKKAQLHTLENFFDDSYETDAQIDEAAYKLNGKVVNPVLSVGLGFGFRLTPRFEVGLEHRMGFTFDDYMDGQIWQSATSAEGHVTKTPHDDILHYTNMFVGINLGKNAQEVSWYVNPLDFTYDYLAYLDEKTNFKDTDDDGVPDLWDQEPDSPEGAVVDTKGITKDSDGDGCPDHEDEEPFSSPVFEIVDCKTQWPKGISEERVVELIKENSIASWFLPSIFFDLNKSLIKAEFYDDLKNIAQVMNMYKNFKVDVVGHTDYRSSEEYNMGLSQRRAEAAVNFLVDNFGVDASRFNIKYLGEGDPLIQDAKTEPELYMNRRVEFIVVPR